MFSTNLFFVGVDHLGIPLVVNYLVAVESNSEVIEAPTF